MERSLSLGGQSFAADGARLFRAPMTVLLVLLIVGYFTNAWQLFAVGSYPIVPFELFQLFFYVFVALAIYFRFTSLTVVKSPLTVVAIGILFSPIPSAIVPIVGGEHFIQWTKTYSHYFFLWLVVPLMLVSDISASMLRSFYRWFVLLMVPITIFGMYQIFARAYDLPLAWIEYTMAVETVAKTTAMKAADGQLSLRFEKFFRATSIFTEPSSLALQIGFCFILLLGPMVRNTKMLFPMWATVLFLFIFSIGMLSTFSLTGLSLLALALLVAFLVARRHIRKKLVAITAAMAVTLFVVDLVALPYTNISVIGLFATRVGNITGLSSNISKSHIVGESFDYRMTNIVAGLDTFFEYPITGIGMGCYYTGAPARKLQSLYTDNMYSQIAAEQGIIGLVAFLFFCGIFMYYSIRLIMDSRTLDRENEDLYSYPVFIVPYILLYGWFGYQVVSGGMALLFGLCAITIRLAWQRRGAVRILS